MNKPLFTTSEDNIDMYPGDTYYVISKSWLGADDYSVIEINITDKWDIKRKSRSLKTFGDKRIAEEFLHLNQKKFSINDVISIIDNSVDKEDLIQKLKSVGKMPDPYRN